MIRTVIELITEFCGEYGCFSNFYRAEVMFEGKKYPTSEHAFQAAKTLDPVKRKEIAVLPTPSAAKRAGRKLRLRDDWERVKIGVMEQILRDKFDRHPHLKKVLLATGDRELREGNDWGDKFWGVVGNTGRNELGKCLMRLRSEYRRGDLWS